MSNQARVGVAGDERHAGEAAGGRVAGAAIAATLPVHLAALPTHSRKWPMTRFETRFGRRLRDLMLAPTAHMTAFPC